MLISFFNPDFNRSLQRAAVNAKTEAVCVGRPSSESGSGCVSVHDSELVLNASESLKTAEEL